jgi:6-phosphogluconolactonase (cycloisomerase 2 family)
MAELCVYISISAEERIATFGLDPGTGALTHRDDFALAGGPGPLALARDGRTLYCSRRGDAILSSLALEGGSGRIRRESGAVSEASQSVYISLDAGGTHLLSCCNGDGRVSAHRLCSDGALSGPPVSTVHATIGAHSVNVDPSGAFVFVPHVGWDGYPLISAGGQPAERAEAKAAYDKSDAVYQFTFDAAGTLAPNATPVLWYEWMARGPRHMRFHPTLPMACECSSSCSSLPFSLLFHKGVVVAQTPPTRCLPPSRPSRSTPPTAS